MAEANFLIQAGHEGLYRNQGSGKTPSHGTSGTPKDGDEEYKLTPIVANKVAELLEAVGYTVIREDAFYDRTYSVDVAVSLHFDGSATPCSSGTSLGYPPGTPQGSNKPAATLWKAAYWPYFPFRKMEDNFTAALRGFYGYSRTNTTKYEFLIEYGELTCPEQSEWLLNRIADNWLARVTAHALSLMVDGPVIPHPGDWKKGMLIKDESKSNVIQAFTYWREHYEHKAAVGKDRALQFLDAYARWCSHYNVNFEIAVTQSWLETGGWSWMGDVKVDQNNFAGIGATGGGVPGESWPTAGEGIRGHVYRLYAYSTDVDFNLTIGKRGLPKFHIGKHPTLESAAETWATDKLYYSKWLRLINDLLASEAPPVEPEPFNWGLLTWHVNEIKQMIDNR